MIQRVAKIFSSKRNTSLRLDHLEYAASIWDPGHKDLIQRLSKIQRKDVRFVKNRYELHGVSHS
jgi:hypothetical protein